MAAKETEPAVRVVAGAGEVNMLCKRGRGCGSCGHSRATKVLCWSSGNGLARDTVRA